MAVATYAHRSQTAIGQHLSNMANGALAGVVWRKVLGKVLDGCQLDITESSLSDTTEGLLKTKRLKCNG
jgi:hypothetical protein